MKFFDKFKKIKAEKAKKETVQNEAAPEDKASEGAEDEEFFEPEDYDGITMRNQPEAVASVKRKWIYAAVAVLGILFSLSVLVGAFFGHEKKAKEEPEEVKKQIVRGKHLEGVPSDYSKQKLPKPEPQKKIESTQEIPKAPPVARSYTSVPQQPVPQLPARPERMSPQISAEEQARQKAAAERQKARRSPIKFKLED